MDEPAKLPADPAKWLADLMAAAEAYRKAHPDEPPPGLPKQ